MKKIHNIIMINQINASAIATLNALRAKEEKKNVADKMTNTI